MLKISKCGLKPHLLIYLLIDINIKLYVTQAERFLVKKKTFGYLSKNRSFHEKKIIQTIGNLNSILHCS